MTTPAPACDETACAARAARAEQRAAMLQEVARVGLKLIRVLDAELDLPAEPDLRQAQAMRYDRVTRAVRRTLALQARLDALQGGEAAKAAERRTLAGRWRAEALAARAVRTAQVGGIVGDIIEAEAPDWRISELDAALTEKLDAFDDDDDPADPDLTALPLSARVAQLCKALGLQPDWSLWEDTDWATAEARAQTPGSPFAPLGAPDGPWSLKRDWRTPEPDPDSSSPPGREPPPS